MALNLLAGFQHMQEQGDQGRMRYADKLLGQAYTAAPDQRQSALAKLAGTDARLAIDADSAFTQRDNSQQDRRRQLLTDRARLIAPMPPEIRAQAWPSLRAGILAADPELAQFLPEQYDEAQFGPVINQLAGLAAGEPKVLSPGSAMYDSSGRLIAQNEFQAPTPQQAVRVPFGDQEKLMVWDPRTGQWSEPAFPGVTQPPAPAPATDGSVATPTDGFDFTDLVGNGVSMTSWKRTPERNAEVGGVPNSAHLTGDGADFIVPQHMKAAFIARVQQRPGWRAIDEGDHVHVQRPRGGAGGSGGMVPTLGLTAPKPGTGPAETLSPEEVEAMGFPKGSVIQRKPDGSLVKVHSPTERDTNGGKALPGHVVNQLTADAEKLNTLTDLQASFRPDYAGNVVGGGVENFLGRLGGERVGVSTQGQATWWQQYDRYKNVIRNELFGSALTPSEQAAFEAADITPNMDPGVIKSNLARQAALVQSALARRAAVWEAQGYNPSAVTAATRAGVGVKPPAEMSDEELMQALKL